jgi:single-strand DNA-binding protein
MADRNEVTLQGRLARDPEIHATATGLQVANLVVATKREWDIDGQRHEATDHHIVVCWRQLSKVAAGLQRGSPVLVQGRLQTRSWADAVTDAKRYRMEVVAVSLEPLELKTPLAAVAGGVDPDEVPF